MDEWQGFFVAQTGASAALAGLVFVSVSISLPKILASPHLPDRAFQALIVLLEILVIASLMLVPQSLRLLGIEVLAAGFAVWIVVAIFDLRSLRGADASYYRRTVYRTGLSQLAAILYVVAGSSILARGAGGVYWLVPAMLGSFLVAMLDAWVLLVEINR